MVLFHFFNRDRTAVTFTALAALALIQSRLLAEPFPTFVAKTLDDNVGKVCYAVTLADVNDDGKQDIVAVTDSRVIWFEAPSWQPHKIIDDQTPKDNVCIAAHDIDRDGQVDFALGAGWTKRGTIHWLSRGETLDAPWEVHFIAEERWLHRMRFADILGKGQPQLVVSPLNATQGDGARLMTFSIPSDPASERWPSTVVNASFNRVHNHWHEDLDHDGQTDTITASREGVHLIRGGKDPTVSKLGDGVDAEKLNDRGAGEVKVGQLANGKRFLVTVEPMHGHSVAVYIESDTENDTAWTRHVIADGFQRGHALWTADLDADGQDEIAFGHSDTPETFGVIVFDCTSEDGKSWTPHVIDAGGMACEDLVVADMTGDGKLDIIAGGRATQNVKLYVQQ